MISYVLCVFHTIAENLHDNAFSLGSAAIAWSSKKQPAVALSSTEAEYRVVVATCEAIWLKQLLKDLQEEVSDPTTIYYDNLNNI